MDEQQVKHLIEYAKNARKNAYVPYSAFPVGAAILTANGDIYSGCNIENASFGLTNCAERTAIFKAVSEQQNHFSAVAVVADTEEPISPCGACRQVLAEFCTKETIIYLANLKGKVQRCTIDQLLPGAFAADDMSYDSTQG